MKFSSLGPIAALALLAASFSVAAHADQLAEIKSRGALVCGVLSTLDPFGYMDPNTREVVGYDVDFCKGVAKQLGVKPELRQLSLDARIPELSQGRVDVLAAVLGYTPARATQIAFSDAYFLSLQKLAVQQDSGLNALADLNDKRISSIKGSSTQNFVKATIPGAKIVSYDDAPSAFMALTQRKVDGFGLTEAMLRRFIIKLGPEATLKVIDAPLGQEQWGLGIKKDEPQLLAAVNTALNKMEESGEAQAIFDKWLGKDSVYHMERTFKVEPIKP
ncbi:polar amino acid transport system substrate-binding protein [Pseudomonas asplenii]|uniref:Polar amino acid transport system substrate-binding protein n=1 Tax=Pseudomonas asplenii TaxID=53407 RepID=A0A1H1X3W9_9PSED|nr:ABC transporter substrate-binding protein [Pseudomonas asplenii]SDT04055.1 polar amino acid transport system substrate-binding protein [Pseudomonas asplenii]